MERAQSQSSAPIRWATCTEKPVDAAAQSPQKSHVVVDTNPIEAEAFAPRLPTIAASMYCMTMAESWVTMAGTLNATVRRSCSPDVIGRPSRIRASRWSVFFFFSFMYVLGLFDRWFWLALFYDHAKFGRKPGLGSRQITVVITRITDILTNITISG